MDEKLKENIYRKDTWIRGLYILLFVIIYGIAKAVIAFITIFQFLSALITGKTNERLIKFGQQMSSFVYQIVMFFTYNSEEKPFPFSSWPEESTDINKTKANGEKKRKTTAGTKAKSSVKKKSKPAVKSA